MQKLSIEIWLVHETRLDYFALFSGCLIRQSSFEIHQGGPPISQPSGSFIPHQVSSKPPLIEADQVTAIYLSPQDPDYFKAKDRPVTLYRYRLQFLPR